MRTLFIFTAFFLSNSVVYSGKESVRLVLLDPIKEEYIEGVKLMDQQGNLIGLSESGIVSVDSKKWENATLRLTHPDYTDTTFQLSQKKGSLFISLTLTSEAHNRWKTFCYPDHTGEYKKLPLDKPDSTAYFQSKDLTSLMRYISKNVQFPQYALERDIQGKVYLMFIVEIDGTVSFVSIAKGVSACIDREALRVIKEMPKWEPAYHEGKPIRTIYRLPINFALR
jgi:TonB family protein